MKGEVWGGTWWVAGGWLTAPSRSLPPPQAVALLLLVLLALLAWHRHRQAARAEATPGPSRVKPAEKSPTAFEAPLSPPHTPHIAPSMQSPTSKEGGMRRPAVSFTDSAARSAAGRKARVAGAQMPVPTALPGPGTFARTSSPNSIPSRERLRRLQSCEACSPSCNAGGAASGPGERVLRSQPTTLLQAPPLCTKWRFESPHGSKPCLPYGELHSRCSCHILGRVHWPHSPPHVHTLCCGWLVSPQGVHMPATSLRCGGGGHRL